MNSSNQLEVAQPVTNMETPGQGNNSFHFGALQSQQTSHANPYSVNPFNISQLLQGHLTPTPTLQKAPTNMMIPSTLHGQNYSSVPFTPTQNPSQFNLNSNLAKSTVPQPSYGPLFDFEMDL